MKSPHSSAQHELPLLTSPALWMCALVGALAITTVRAAETDSINAVSAKEQYEHDKSYCNSGQATEARALCLKEASRAYAEAKRGTLEPSDMEPTSAGPTSAKHAAHHKHHAKPAAGSTGSNSDTTNSSPYGSGNTDAASGSAPPANQTQQQGTTR